MHSKISRCSILVLLSVILTALLSFASYSMPTDAVSERVELRTETSKHWQNSDGTLTAEIFSGPVHYRDIDGAWKEIDTRLEPSEKAGFAHSATKNRFKSHLAADAKGRHAVELEGIEFAFTADVLEAALGTVEDSSITYANAWPDADLKYTVLPMGIKEDIILKSKPSVSQFRFIVKSGGLEPVTADRGINFVDKDGKVVVFIPGPFMIDANGAYSDAVEATWRSLSDGTVELLLEPDQEWLSKAVYPVVIDPTFYAATGTGAASMDATLTRLQQLYPPPTPPSTSYSWNYSNSYLTIGRYTSSPNTWTLYGCIKWDISSVPQNAVVEDTSYIELNKYTSGSTNKNLRLNKITQAWPPSARPISVSVLEQYFNGYVGTPDRFPSEAEDKAAFCQMVQGWIWDQSTNHGVEFEPVTGGDYNVQVWASEGSYYYCPKLVIDYSLDTTPPNPGTATSPAYANTSPIVVNYSGASDETGGSGLKTVELWFKKGMNGTWTNSGQSLTTASGSFNFTGMTGDDTYYFDLRAQDNAGNWSDTPSGDGDCHTLYVDGGASSTGRVTIQTEYLYPGAYAKRSTVYDENGINVKQVSVNYGLEAEVLSTSGDVQQASVVYDALYRVKSLTDPNNQQTSYIYDLSGNLTQINLPGGETVQIPDHDDCGRVTRAIDSKGQEVTYEYNDPSNLLTAIRYTNNSTYDTSIYYDAVYGRCTSWSDKECATSYTYDDRGAVTSTTTSYTNGPQNKTISASFYDNGSVNILATPDGNFTFTYDAAGRVVGLLDSRNAAFSWSYLDNDRLETQVSPVTTATYTYNPRGQITSLTNRLTGGTLLSQFGSATTPLSYDALGNLLSSIVDIPSVSLLSGTTSYDYNSLDELTLEASTRNGGYSFPFIYNGAGNPTTFKGVTHDFDSVKNQRTDTGFIYDANGNPTTYKGISGLEYDPNNHLITYPGTLTAGYHGGLRAWKQTGTGRTYFLYAGIVPVCEMNSSGTVTAVNTAGPNGLLARHEGVNTVFYTFDDGGDVTQTLNSSGTVLSTELYDAYGNRLAIDGTNNTPYGYCGQFGYYTDRETGLMLATNRYYDPTEGRWLTHDPIGYAGGLNLYGYCGNNPVNYTDPLGLRREPFAESIWNIPSKIVHYLGRGTVYEGPTFQSAGQGNEELCKAIPEVGEYYEGYREGGKAISETLDECINTIGWEVAGQLAGGFADDIVFVGRYADDAARAAGGSNKGLVIGKLDDLNQPGALRPGEYRLQWPNQGSPKANWKENSGLLRKEMAKGLPIRDIGTKDTGFLKAERNLLRNHGWTFDPNTGYWYPPK